MNATDKVFPMWEKIDREISEYIAEGRYDFTEWEQIRNTMLPIHAKFISKELMAIGSGFVLTKNNETNKREIANIDWLSVIEDDTLGKNYQYPSHPKSTENTIHHTYCLKQWCVKTGNIFLDLGTIMEFGAGYGNTCRIIKNKLGFQGNYYIVDLPGISELQKYYLYKNKVSNVHWEKPTECDLLIANWSLSEVPHELKDEILSIPHKHLLVNFAATFDELNNMEYFKRFDYEQIHHIPNSFSINE